MSKIPNKVCWGCKIVMKIKCNETIANLKRVFYTVGTQVVISLHGWRNPLWWVFYVEGGDRQHEAGICDNEDKVDFSREKHLPC